jgi:hypothetical protein
MLGTLRPAPGGGGAVSSVYGRTGAVTAVTGDYSTAQIAGLGASAGDLVFTPRTTQTVVNATVIAIGGAIVPITSTGAVSLTSNPQIAVGTNGQRVTLINVGSNPITFVNGNGLILPQSSIPLYGGRVISFTYMSLYSSWLLDGVIPESLALTGAPTVPTAGINTGSTQIASTAYVNQSNRPYVAAHRGSTTQAIPNAAFTKIIYNTETTDLNSIHDPSTGIITIPSGMAGVYQINAGILLDGACQILALGIFNSTSNAEIKRLQTFESSANAFTLPGGSTTLPLNAGDQIDVRLFQTNSGALARNVSADSRYSHVSMWRLNV